MAPDAPRSPAPSNVVRKLPRRHPWLVPRILDVHSLNLVVCLGFFMTAARCSLVCDDSLNEVEDHDGMAAGVGIDDWR